MDPRGPQVGIGQLANDATKDSLSDCLRWGAQDNSKRLRNCPKGKHARKQTANNMFLRAASYGIQWGHDFWEDRKVLFVTKMFGVLAANHAEGHCFRGDAVFSVTVLEC